ncbi:MAG: hypothetical protein FP820_04915 [Sulfurimonas sp.]|nr:hypothetical protein [Sulfurimonas sp.]MBU3939995.1 zonular occludens toxin domain-containing protein [bacterium]MBU4058580.1 zonular occludens toxin domain-containing protein [bacterium]
MIQIFTGLPRTGKTYRAVKYIYDSFVDSSSSDFKKFLHLHTNIGGFKIDELNEQLLVNPLVINDDEAHIKRVHKFDWDNIYKHILKAYDMSNNDKEDEELIKYLSYHSLSPALFVIDECYRYFTKKSDPVLVWWLAYHGHLGMDIILILQNKALMHSDYKSFTEFFIDAQSKSKSFSNNTLRYYHYASDTYTKEQRFTSDSLKADDKIFALYKSGDAHKPKKIIYKFIGLMILAVFAVLFFINLLLSNMKDRYKVPDEAALTNSEQIASVDSTIDSSSDFLNIRCNERYCWNVDKIFQDNQITLQYFKYIVIKYKLELQFEEIKNEIYSLKPYENALSKKTFAKLTDYYYTIPNHLKNTYLKELFIPRVIERKGLEIDSSVNPMDNMNTNMSERSELSEAAALGG